MRRLINRQTIPGQCFDYVECHRHHSDGAWCTSRAATHLDCLDFGLEEILHRNGKHLGHLHELYATATTNTTTARRVNADCPLGLHIDCYDTHQHCMVIIDIEYHLAELGQVLTQYLVD